MQLVARLRRELSLLEARQGAVVCLGEREYDDGLAIVGVGLLPDERVRESCRPLLCEELAAEMKQLSLGGLHRDPVPAARPDVELHLRRREPSRSPPLLKLARVHTRREHLVRRGGERALEAQREPAHGPFAPGIQSVPASGTLAIAAASTVSATRSSGSRLWTCDFPHARASVCVSSVRTRRKLARRRPPRTGSKRAPSV